jgi:hypothetical protein
MKLARYFPLFIGLNLSGLALAQTERPVTWKQAFEKVISPKCVICHNPANADRADLSTYEKFKAVFPTVYGVTLLAIGPDDFVMPPSPMPPLTKEDKQILADFLVDGLLLNSEKP